MISNTENLFHFIFKKTSGQYTKVLIIYINGKVYINIHASEKNQSELNILQITF